MDSCGNIKYATSIFRDYATSKKNNIKHYFSFETFLLEFSSHNMPLCEVNGELVLEKVFLSKMLSPEIASEGRSLVWVILNEHVVSCEFVSAIRV